MNNHHWPNQKRVPVKFEIRTNLLFPWKSFIQVHMLQSKLIFRTISIKIYQSVLQVAADTKEYTANQ